MTSKYYLIPKKDSRASFYKKAEVIVKDDGTKILKSYESKVCKINKEGCFILNNSIREDMLFSQTTLRHIKEFLFQELNITGIRKKELKSTLNRVW